ncbi:uncharacterized protein LOC129616005 [Condylostylus longicornis]|uniref:uncharacterized protein LOC129616005 n=1 Tax=Condylostylus longicornis TaxID=2530218 RepID=UPI00244E2A70|nr:uncharacterized protein LOC129616005 [Condylostylus longicornis]
MYVSSQEQVWHLLDIPIHGQSHSVVMLSIHLKDGQSIFFEENRAENVLRQESVRSTTLTAYFDLNRSDPTAHELLYQDIPNRYIFKNKKIIAVSPKNVELYHLRLILLSVKGSEATSFEELKIFNGQTYSSYKEVARVRGLINDSGEWYNCMNDAVSYMMPKALRLLFVTIICHCNPTNPLQLFEEFKKHMIEDFIHEGNNNDQSIILCILDIKKQTENIGFDFCDLCPLSILEDINYDQNPDNIVVDNTTDIL